MLLVVEDNWLIGLDLFDGLSGLGYASILCTSAEDALGVLRNRQDVALLITDIQLPGKDGVWLAQEARRIHADLPVIFVTAYRPKDRPDAAALGPIVAKPTSVDVLKNLIKTTIGRRH